MPIWGDLIALIPFVLIAIVIAFLVFMAWQWRRAAPVNRPRLIPRAAGVPPPGVHVSAPSRWPFVAPIALTLLFFALVVPPRDAAGHSTAPFNVPLLVAGLIVGLITVVGWLREAMAEWRHAALVEEGSGGHGALMATGAAIALPSGTWRGSSAAAPSVPLIAAAPSVALPEGVHLPGPSPWPFFAPVAIAVVFLGLIFNPFLIVGGIVMGVIAAGGWLRDANREWRSTDRVGHAVPATMEGREAWPRRLVPLYGAVFAISLLLAFLP